MDTQTNDDDDDSVNRPWLLVKAGTMTILAPEEKSEAAEMGKRFKTARGARSQKQMADLVGVHYNSISKVERGHEPGTALLKAIAKATDTCAAWLLTGESYQKVEPALSQAPHQVQERLPVCPTATALTRSVKAVERGEYVYVPHFDIRANAGSGIFNDVENVVAMRPFDANYVRHKLGITHVEIALLDVGGRSMEPRLHSGDVIMVDRRDKEALEGDHVIRLDGMHYVKTLQRMPGRVLRVTSRNEEFAPFEIGADEDSQRDFEVIGRVRWAGITVH